MELKTLFLGMIISMAAFSVKSGVGMAYMLSGRRGARKISAAALVLASYGALFAAAALLAVRVNILAGYEFFRPLLSSGVTIHWVLAIFTFIWGLILLKKPANDECHGGRGSRAWLALVVPCPVCATVVLMSASCVALYFPKAIWLSIAALYAAFAAISAVSCAVMLTAAVRQGGSPEESLGTAMILIAAYFMISALVMPQFAEISRIYRIALYSGESRASDPSASQWTLTAIIAMLGIGFLRGRNNIKDNLPQKTRLTAGEHLK
ncbi:MAG: DUF2162 domain-containing protein [Synergistaceae bacterium]|nr:DUF2162 domain-containing protein [Synergistaceae bacterium]